MNLLWVKLLTIYWNDKNIIFTPVEGIIWPQIILLVCQLSKHHLRHLLFTWDNLMICKFTFIVQFDALQNTITQFA